MQRATGDQARFWDQWIVDSAAWEQNPENARRVKFVLEAAGAKTRTSILEIGCGSGWVALKLAELGSLLALDLAHDAIAALRTRYPSVGWIDSDFLSADLPRASFDLIVCMETISHVPDQLAFARRIAELSVPGGTLVLTTQNPYVWNRTSWLKPPAPGQLRNWPSRARLVELFEPDFRIERLTTCAPAGNRGLPLLFNNRLSRAVGNALIGSERWTHIREMLGLGCSLTLLGTRKENS